MPAQANSEPIYHEESEELMGYVEQVGSIWRALTLFGYEFATLGDRQSAVARVLADGLSLLKGVWQYYDTDDDAWYPCVIKGFVPGRVTVIRTSSLGLQDRASSKFYTISNPDSSKLTSPF